MNPTPHYLLLNVTLTSAEQTKENSLRIAHNGRQSLPWGLVPITLLGLSQRPVGCAQEMIARPCQCSHCEGLGDWR